MWVWKRGKDCGKVQHKQKGIFMAFGAIIIGDEILSGKRQDKHLAKVIDTLKIRGLELSWADYIGDEPARITATLKRTFATKDIVFSFGGIGATPDDYTRQCAAAALGVPIARHAEAEAEIVARFGEAAFPKRVIMADFPHGADMIPNPFNRIAGFSVGTHYFLPGFPEMSWPMMEWVLDTQYKNLFHPTPRDEKIIVIENGNEGDLLDLMNQVVASYDKLKLSSLPQFVVGGGRRLELSVRGDPSQVAEAMMLIKQTVSQMRLTFSDKQLV
jgi:molybdopterin-biosynthesis enzyme MoeA-like protein